MATNQDLFNNFVNQLISGDVLARNTVPSGFYGRVSDSNAPEMQELLDRYASASMGAPAHGNASNRALVGLSNLATNSGRSPEEQRYLDNLSRSASLGMEAVGQLPQLLRAQGELLSSAGQIDPLVQDVVNRRQAGLSGLNSAENTAMREQLLADTSRGFNSAIGRAADVLGANGVSGGAAQARMDSLARDYLGSVQDFNQKQMLANVDVQNQRLADYDNLARYVSDSGFAKRLNALEPVYNSVFASQGLLNDYGSAVGAQNQAEFQRGTLANQNLLGGVQSYNSFNTNDLNNRLNNYANFLNANQTDLLNRQTFNLNQLSREQADRRAIQFGTPSYLNTQRANNLSQDIGYANLNQAEQRAKIPQTPNPGLELTPINPYASGLNNPY